VFSLNILLKIFGFDEYVESCHSGLSGSGCFVTHWKERFRTSRNDSFKVLLGSYVYLTLTCIKQVQKDNHKKRLFLISLCPLWLKYLNCFSSYAF